MWGGLVEPIASLVPYMVAIGNHEEVHIFETCEPLLTLCQYYNATSFMHRFYMPGYENGGNTNLWYRYAYIPQRRAIANIYAVLTTDSCTGSSSQLKTLTPQALLSTNGLSRYILVSNECVSYVSQDLIAAQKNRANVNWIIFVTHRPMYCSDLDELNQHEVGADIRYIRTVRPPPLPPFFSS